MFESTIFIDVEGKINNINQLLYDIEQKREKSKCGEQSLKRLNDLTSADLEQTKVCLNQLILNKGIGFSPYRNPSRPIEKLLRAYGLLEL